VGSRQKCFKDAETERVQLRRRMCDGMGGSAKEGELKRPPDTQRRWAVEGPLMTNGLAKSLLEDRDSPRHAESDGEGRMRWSTCSRRNGSDGAPLGEVPWGATERFL